MTTIRTRLDPTDERLRTVCKDISLRELRLKKNQQVIDALLEFVYARNNKGEKHNRKKPTIIGLSANQVGVMERICIVDLAVRRNNYSDVHVLINPHILWKSKTTNLRKEGCVNLPNVWGYVARSQKIDVSYVDRWGNAYTVRAVGWAATLIQHEVDHLNGYLFIDRLSDPKKALLVRDEDLVAYKKDPKNWNTFTDVSRLCRSL
ncbi:MAG: peptide deformylase [bacterium]|nr:peptide deformylase [bacterium]